MIKREKHSITDKMTEIILDPGILLRCDFIHGQQILESEPQGDEVIMSLKQIALSKGEDSPMRLVPAPIEELKYMELTQRCSSSSEVLCNCRSLPNYKKDVRASQH